MYVYNLRHRAKDGMTFDYETNNFVISLTWDYNPGVFKTSGNVLL